MAYVLKLYDGATTLDLMDGTAYDLIESGLRIPPPRDRSSWGGASSLFRDGADLVKSRYENRAITARLKIMGADLDAIKTNIRAINAMLERARERTVMGYGTGVTLEYRVDSVSVYFDVLRGELVLPPTFMSAVLDRSKTVLSSELRLTCKPFARLAEVTLADDYCGNVQSVEYADICDANKVKGAVADDGGVQTDETAVANSAAANDMTLLPATPAVDDAYYFGDEIPFTTLALNIGTQGMGTWTIIWEYWDGDSWEALSGVTDGTTGFTAATGLRNVTFTEPTDWAVATVDSIEAFWIRARVSAYTSITTQPLGTQAWIQNIINYIDFDALSCDVAGKLKLKIVQVGATGTKKVWIARRSGSRRTNDLWQEGEAGTFYELAPSGVWAGSTQTAIAASEGRHSRVSLSSGSAGAEIIGYHQFQLSGSSCQGQFRVLARCRSDNIAVARFGIGYSMGDITVTPTHADSDDWQFLAVNATWEVLDLGVINIPPYKMPDGETWPNFYLRIYEDAYTATSIYFDLDYVFLLPSDEAVAIIDDVVSTDRILLDSQSDIPGVYILNASDAVTNKPNHLGSSPLLGQEATRIYIIRDDDIDVTFTVTPKYIPQYMEV